jgi:hypothetical protein
LPTCLPRYLTEPQNSVPGPDYSGALKDQEQLSWSDQEVHNRYMWRELEMMAQKLFSAYGL